MIKATKARTKSARRFSKAGRPRKNGERYPSGDIKRSETEKETKSVAIAAAMRIHKIETDGKDGLHAYTLGRMFLDQKITRHELEAGNWYSEQMERYYRATGIPSPNPRAQDLLAVRGHDGDPSKTIQERATRATNMMMRLEGILLKAGAGVKQTVRNVCIEDNEALRLMPPAQLRLLKSGLQALMFAKGVDG
jgi:hypothetical protein